MKTIIKRLAVLITVLSVMTACEEDPVIFDSNNGQSFLKFEASSVDLPVPRTGSETISIPISVSTISNTERTVTVSVVQDETTLDPANFSVNSQVVIPANSFVGMVEVTGTNADLVVGEVETITLRIEGFSAEDFSIGGDNVTVRAFLSCPYDPQEFVGTYLADEEGFDTPYEVEVTYDPNTEMFRFENLYTEGSMTYAKFSYDNGIASVDFQQNRDTNFGVLYVSSSFGNVYAVNPSVASGTPSSNISTFRTCDNFIDLYFRRQIQDGRFFGGTPHISLTKIEEGEGEGEGEDE